MVLEWIGIGIGSSPKGSDSSAPGNARGGRRALPQALQRAPRRQVPRTVALLQSLSEPTSATRGGVFCFACSFAERVALPRADDSQPFGLTDRGAAGSAGGGLLQAAATRAPLHRNRLIEIASCAKDAAFVAHPRRRRPRRD